MQELLVDFITSLDGYGAAEGWPGWWGLEGPEYLAWLGQQPERDYTILMGANTYRLMSGFATESKTSASDEPMTDEGAAIAELARASKVVFSSTLQPPLSWPNTRLISGDAVEAVAAMKQDGTSPMHPRQPDPVPVAPRGRPGGPFPRGRLPRGHREHRPRPHLRRVSRCHPRDGCQPNVRRQTPAARVRPHGAHRTSRLAPRFLRRTAVRTARRS